MCRVVYYVDKLYFLSFSVALCCTLGIERHLFSPKLNARQNRVKVLQNDFFYFQNRNTTNRTSITLRGAVQTGTNTRTR